jgi:hypothetical protein
MNEVQKDVKKYGFGNINKDLDKTKEPLYLISEKVCNFIKKNNLWGQYKKRTIVVKNRSLLNENL